MSAVIVGLLAAVASAAATAVTWLIGWLDKRLKDVENNVVKRVAAELDK